MALDQRQQIMVVVGVVFAAAAGLYWYMPYSDKAAEQATHRLKVDSLIKTNRQIQLLSVSTTLQQYRDEAARFQRELAVMRRLVPSSNEVPTLLDGITSAARSAGLDISDISPAGMTEGDNFNVYKFSLGVSGPYHRVADLLTNIGSMERIVAPMNVQLILGPAVVREKRPRRNEVFVTATFMIQTYVAKAPPPPAPPAPPAAKAGGM